MAALTSCPLFTEDEKKQNENQDKVINSTFVDYFDLTNMDKPIKKGDVYKITMNVKSDNLTDIVFLVGPKQERIISHRMLLALSNDVFQKLFDRTNDKEIIVPDLEPYALRLVLGYIFTGNIILTNDNMLHVYEAAIKYGVNKLITQCGLYIVESIKKDNLLDILEFNKKYRNYAINKRCRDVLLENPLYYFTLDKFHLLSGHFIALLKEMSNIDVEERELFKLAMRWNHANRPGDQSQTFEQFLQRNKPASHSRKYKSDPKMPVSHKKNKPHDIDITGTFKSSLFSGLNDASTLSFQVKSDIILNTIGYYIGAPHDSGKKGNIWILLFEHKAKPVDTRLPIFPPFYKKMVPFTYTKHLHFEYHTFGEEILLSKNKYYEIKIMFDYDETFRAEQNHRKLARYYLESKNLKVSENNVFKLTTSENLIIIYLSFLHK